MENKKKTVAIIGAGRSGLASLKNALEQDLDPVIFEKTSEPYGLWSKGTPVWENMFTNVSQQSMSFIDHPWSKYPGPHFESTIYPRAFQVRAYMKSYIDRFCLEKYIRFESRVDSIDILPNKQWKVIVTNLKTNETHESIFDFVIIASGTYSKPKIPEYQNSSQFKGEILHSYNFRDSIDFTNKRVVVVGCARSGSDLSVYIARHGAKKVSSIIRNPYLMFPILAATKIKPQTDEDTEFDQYNIVPLDNYMLRRKNTYLDPDSTDIDLKNQAFSLINELNIEQTDKEKSHPALYVDINSPNSLFSLKFSMSDQYYEMTKNGQINTKCTTIKSFDSNGVFLNDGSYEEADIVLLCTGYKPFIDHLPKFVRDALKHEEDSLRFNLFKKALHPEVPNLAFVGQFQLLFFGGTDLQAKWVTMVS
jgi:thioredoxin reductase